MDSLFIPLHHAGLTTIRIQYAWKSNQVILSAAREWGMVEWARYRQDFSHETLLTDAALSLGHEDTLALYRNHGLAGHLESIVTMMRAGRHERVEGRLYPERDIRFFNNVHSSVLGLDNGRHAIRAGGIRRHAPDEDEREVVFDGLNLSRGMSFKNAAAGIPFGGCKSLVVSDPLDLHDHDALGFIAYCIDRTRSFTGPDMGLTPALTDVMHERYSRNFTGGFEGKLGPTGGPTAYGTYLAMRVACGFVFGSEDLDERSIAIMGLGAVGRPLAERLLQDGARLIVADVDPAAADDLLRAFPAADGHRIEVVAPESILEQQADIFSPSAVGGIFTAQNIPRLRYRAIIGAANNTLRASGQEEEIRLARLMQEHGILYQVEWVHNIAGVLAGWEEWTNGEQASMANILGIIEERCPAATRHNLTAAAAEGLTPTEVAYRDIEERIYR